MPRTPVGAARPAIVLLLALSAPACATSLQQPHPERGTLTVGLTAQGAIVSTLGVRVSVEPAGISERVKADRGVLTRRDVPLGEHVVRIVDLPAPCRIDGPAERPIALSPQRPSAVLRFHVVCN